MTEKRLRSHREEKDRLIGDVEECLNAKEDERGDALWQPYHLSGQHWRETEAWLPMCLV